jgi:tetratricopeptide (TPR) repeat protein
MYKGLVIISIISLIKPLRKYEDYVYKANTYENLFLRKKAIQILNIAIKQPNFSKEEKSSGFIYLGILYSKIKEYKLASDCYHQGLELMINENFKYHNNFKQAIEAFIKNEDFERAKFWLTNLIQRQSYDKKFKKLAVLEKKVQ